MITNWDLLYVLAKHEVPRATALLIVRELRAPSNDIKLPPIEQHPVAVLRHRHPTYNSAHDLGKVRDHIDGMIVGNVFTTRSLARHLGFSQGIESLGLLDKSVVRLPNVKRIDGGFQRVGLTVAALGCVA